jgi:hypothetical protein
MLVDHITLTLSPNLALSDKHMALGIDPKNKNKIQILGTASGKTKEKLDREIRGPEGNKRPTEEIKFGT